MFPLWVSCEERKQEACVSLVNFVWRLFWFRASERKRPIKLLARESLKIFTWYWTGALRDQACRLNEFPSRLYHRWLVGDDWGSWRLIIGGKVTDFARCFAAECLWRSFKFATWSKDFERWSSFGWMRIELGGISKWSVLMSTPLRDDFRSILFSRGGLIEILAGGGDESKSEKRRNILNRHLS